MVWASKVFLSLGSQVEGAPTMSPKEVLPGQEGACAGGRRDRFPRVSKEHLSSEQRSVYERIEASRGSLPAPYYVLLDTPRVADLFERLSSQVRDGVLPKHILEAVFLATARRYKCAYQWLAHVKVAERVGLSPAAIQAIGSGNIPDGPEDVALVLRFMAALDRHHSVSDEVYDALLSMFGAQGIGELIVFCGLSRSERCRHLSRSSGFDRSAIPRRGRD